MKDTDVDGRVLKWISKKLGSKVRSGFLWLNVGLAVLNLRVL